MTPVLHAWPLSARVLPAPLFPCSMRTRLAGLLCLMALLRSVSLTVAAASGLTPPPASQVSILLQADCPTLTFAPLPKGIVGKFYRGTVKLSSEYQGYYLYFANEQIPEGLWLEGGATFSGFPTQAGSYELDIIAVNESSGCTFYVKVPWTIEEDLSPCPFSLPDSLPMAVAKQPYLASVAASPAGSYTYTIVQGQLGEYFSLDTTIGVITGEALLGDGVSFEFVISATDSNGCSKQKAYTITTTCPAPPTFAPLPKGQVGVPYSTYLTPTGGTGGYRYYLVPSSKLPSGLHLNEFGEISGIPVEAGSFYVHILANGAALCDGYVSDTLLIKPAIGSCQATGTILRETWVKVKGYDVRQIPINTPPTATRQLTSFEGPSNVTNEYGDRIRGYICPPMSGSYTFWIASDDNSALFLSSDHQASNKQRIAWVNGATQPRQWSKYASQQSAPIYLEAGKKYYIESLHKEAYGGDHLSVGWQQPDNSAIQVIPGAVLSPYSNSIARLAVQEQAPVEVVRAYPNPFEDKLTLRLGREGKRQQMLLLDAIGRVVYETTVKVTGQEWELDLSAQDLKPGIYLLKLQAEHGQSQSIRVIKK
ncbi:T9SS type A sorting domain-containing protein [Rhodocytophaga rosea]|uniref:T9SS type A sorting domain-containing protein n=1 Tax=Rhodocytophaga rosea TaxID=2704465 RepID=A0A6C0GRT7_9BACT|nr:putative Ig domain-containing protein [Rhodocytophaga rosea]QHT70805.1 T9SS type A sorting domain-containing protein [Rhodocytophaga rosea]